MSAQSHTGVNSVTFQSAAWLSQVSVGDYILGTNLTGQPGVIIHARVNTLGVVYDSVDDNYTIHADVLYFSPELDFDLTDQYWTISAYYRSAVAAGDVIGLAQGDAGALDSDTRLVTVDGDTLEQTTIGELDLVSRPSHLGDVTEFLDSLRASLDQVSRLKNGNGLAALIGTVSRFGLAPPSSVTSTASSRWAHWPSTFKAARSTPELSPG